MGGDTHLGGQDFDWALMKVALRVRISRPPSCMLIVVSLLLGIKWFCLTLPYKQRHWL